MEQFVEISGINDSNLSDTVMLNSYRNTELRQSLTEIGSTVERVDDPSVFTVVILQSRLFRKYRMMGICRLYMVDDEFLGSLVGSRHYVTVVKLRLYFKLVTAKISQMHSPASRAQDMAFNNKESVMIN